MSVDDAQKPEVPGDQGHRFVIRDRDMIYSDAVDRTLEAMELSRAPAQQLEAWVPDSPRDRVVAANGHRLPNEHRVVAPPI